MLYIFISDLDRGTDIGLIKFIDGRKLEGGIVNMINERLMIQNELGRLE